VVHGGIVAAVLDEVMGNVLLMKTKRLCFTLRFSLKYLAPVLVEKDFSAYAEIKDMNGDFAEVQGSIYDQEDGLVVRAKGTYKAISLEEAIKVMDIDEATLEEFLVFFR
jgi:acyl-CoA thioesterase